MALVFAKFIENYEKDGSCQNISALYQMHQLQGPWLGVGKYGSLLSQLLEEYSQKDPAISQS